MKCNTEEEEGAYGDGKYGIFRNNGARNVWAEYMGLMTGQKRDGMKRTLVVEKKFNQRFTGFERVYAWIMNVLQCLRRDENRDENPQKHYVDKF